MRIKPLQPLATHTLAMLLGCGAVWLGGRQTPGWLGHSASQPPPRISSGRHVQPSERLTSSKEFREITQRLLNRDVSTDERSDAMSRLIEEWAQCDPAGLIRFLAETPTWPADLTGWELPASLAASRPDLLLDLAMRQGLHGALATLNAADPATLVRLIENLPAAAQGPAIRKALAEAQRKLGQAGLPVAGATPAYLQGEAEAALEDGDLDGFVSRFMAIKDKQIRLDLIRSFQSALSSERPSAELLALILRLPPEARDEAAGAMTIDDLDQPENRAALRDWITTLVAYGMSEAAAGYTHRLLVGDDPRAKDELTAWVKTLPADERWQRVVKAIGSQWFSQDREAMLRGMAGMPAGAVRDAFARIALSTTDLIGHLPPAAAGRVLQLIADPELKAELGAELESRLQPDPAPGTP